MVRRSLVAALALALALVASATGLGAAVARAATGALDPGWGGDGVVTVAGDPPLVSAGGGDRVLEVVNPRDPDPSRRVEARRYAGDGDLDPGFGEAGVSHLRLPRAGFLVTAVALDDGRVLAVGDASGNVMLAMLRPDGRLDGGFHVDGFGFSGDGSLAQRMLDAVVWVGPTGEIRVGVRFVNSVHGGVFTHVFRFGPRGRLLGTMYLPQGLRVLFAPNGDLMVQRGVVTRRSAVTGAKVDAFGRHGNQRDQCGANNFHLLVDSLGRSTLICHSRPSALRIVRLRNDGQLDPTFGSGGIARLRVRPEVAAAFEPTQALLAADGTIVLPVAFGDDDERLWIGQVGDDGAWDPGFGVAGRATLRRPAGAFTWPTTLVPWATLTEHRVVIADFSGSVGSLVAIDRR